MIFNFKTLVAIVLEITPRNIVGRKLIRSQAACVNKLTKAQKPRSRKLAWYMLFFTQKVFPATSRFHGLGAQPYVFEPLRLIPNIWVAHFHIWQFHVLVSRLQSSSKAVTILMLLLSNTPIHKQPVQNMRNIFNRGSYLSVHFPFRHATPHGHPYFYHYANGSLLQKGWAPGV